MPTIDFSRYYRYAELTEALHGFVQEYPQLASLESIGKSHEGRDIWCITITNSATGSAIEKPGYWLDGNLHASEHSGCMGSLHAINRLLTSYASDESVKRLVDTRTFYIVPCINPDGMEWTLTSPVNIRSGTRLYPYADERDGLYLDDIDGNGIIADMRIADPDGNWKVSDKDPRLMRPRDPDEEGGQYYRVYREGMIRNYDGYEVKIAPAPRGLDYNRNFGFGWVPENEQAGAGPYPLSEPETRAVAEFIIAHPNISCGITYHTYSGVILRPSSTKPDDDMIYNDLVVFKEMGERGTAITGYPTVSIYHDFRYHPKMMTHGAFDEWAYEAQGIYTFTVELWDIIGEAGIKDRDFIGWLRNHPEEDDLKILRWIDENTDGKGFLDWTPFDHPQLGRVEIGGFVDAITFRNPPGKFLEQTLKPSTEFVLAHARMTPRLELREWSAEQLGEGIYRLRALLVNSGYLPSYGSEVALNRKVAQPIEVELTLPEGAKLLSGQQKSEIGHLGGRANKQALWGGMFPNDHQQKLEWIVEAPAGSSVTVVAKGGRAGWAKGEVSL
jgi:murein tripeptide amidase MpaA